MELFVNEKNLSNLKYFFVKNCKNFLIKKLLEKPSERDKIKPSPDLKISIDTNSALFPSYHKVLPKIIEFLTFTHKIFRLTGIFFNIGFKNIPYCVFHFPQNRIEYLIENEKNAQKRHLSACGSCRYKDSCGGVEKKYLDRYGEKEFHPVKNLPYQIMLEIEPRCNLNCQWCFNKNTFAKNAKPDAPKPMSSPLIKEIIEEIARLKIPTIRFTGGEPLLRQDALTLLAYAKEKNLHVILNSNGILIDETMAKKLNGLVDVVLISLQGMGKKGDQAVGKEGATREKINAFSNLAKYTKTEIFVSTILRPQILENECRELKEIHDLIEKAGIVSRWHLCRCVPETEKKYQENKKNYSLLIDRLIDWQLGKKNFFLHHYPYVISNGIPFCFDSAKRTDLVSYGSLFIDGYSRLAIDPFGNIKPIYYSNLILSDNPMNISEAWNHHFLTDLRNLKFLPKKCSDCFYKRKCLGGSRFLAKMLSGSYASSDPLMES